MKKGDKLEGDESLLRRVYRKDKRYRDPKTGRPTSRAFAPRPKDDGKLSVDIERLTTLEKAIIDPIKFALFRFSNSILTTLGLICIYDPLISQDFENQAHSLILGFQDDDESVPGILARKAKYVEFP